MQLSTSTLEKMDLDEEVSSTINGLINSGLKEEELWEKVCVQVLPRLKNFSKHKLIHSYIFQSWDEKEKGPVPWWISKKEQQKSTNLYKFIQTTGKIKKQTYENEINLPELTDLNHEEYDLGVILLRPQLVAFL